MRTIFIASSLLLFIGDIPASESVQPPTVELAPFASNLTHQEPPITKDSPPELSSTKPSAKYPHPALYCLPNFKGDTFLTTTFLSVTLRKINLVDALLFISKHTSINIAINPTIQGTIPLLRAEHISLATLLTSMVNNHQPRLVLYKHKNMWHITTEQKAETFLHATYARTFQQAIYTLKHLEVSEKVKMKLEKMWEHIIADAPSQPLPYLIIDDATRKLFFTGTPQHLSRFKKFLHEIDVQPAQVRIEARIVIADKHFEESFGTQWLGNYKPLQKPDGLELSTFPQLWQATKNSHLSLLFGAADLTKEHLNLLLNAAEHNHEIHTILKPSIITNDREIAEILEGEVVPIDTIVEESVEGRLRNVRTANYKDVGIQLRVRPVVNALRTTIALDLFIENSRIQQDASKMGNHKSHIPAISYPTIMTTRSKTRVILKNGQTTVISGLIKNRNGREQSAIPFLARIPVLGWLFKGKRKQKNDVQLLVFLTPTIVP